MHKLLVLCPSRARPKRLMEMISNFKETTNSSHTRMLVLLDRDDSCLGQYLQNIPEDIDYKIFNREGDKTYTTEIVNRAFEQNKHYEFYSVTNDDMFYQTKGWDETLSVKGRVSCGKEFNVAKRYGWFRNGVHKACFPFTSVIDGDLARKVGWLQLPDLRVASGDSVWYWLARRLNKFNPKSHIEYRHKSHYFDDGEYDETAKRTDCHKNMDDYVTFRRWKNHKMMDIVKSIKEKKLCHSEQTIVAQ